MIGNTIAEINDIAGSVAEAIGEQGGATREIKRNAEEAAAGTGQVSAAVANVLSAADETKAAADQVIGEANLVNSQATRLDSVVAAFVKDIEATTIKA